MNPNPNLGVKPFPASVAPRREEDVPHMKIALASRNGNVLMPLLAKMGFQIDQKEPDVVISYGGDGTLLGAERDWPGIPKLAIRQSSSAIKCPEHEDQLILERLARGDISQTVLMKLEGMAKGRRLLAINDVGLHHSVPTSGVRYRLWINDEPYSGEIVGDGLVVSTPFGSSAYYRSITRSFFRSGIGVAFNNTTEPLDHLVVSEVDVLRLVVTRGPAVLVADNSPEVVTLVEGDEARICKASEWTVVLAIDTLLCDRCRRRDGTPFARLGGLRTL